MSNLLKVYVEEHEKVQTECNVFYIAKKDVKTLKKIINRVKKLSGIEEVFFNEKFLFHEIHYTGKAVVAPF